MSLESSPYLTATDPVAARALAGLQRQGLLLDVHLPNTFRFSPTVRKDYLYNGLTITELRRLLPSVHTPDHNVSGHGSSLDLSPKPGSCHKMRSTISSAELGIACPGTCGGGESGPRRSSSF